MDNENKVETENVDTEKVDTNKVDTETKTDTEDSVTMSKSDFEKAKQSAEDKVRTKYVKDIKALEDKIKELTPVQKSASEIELENRLKTLEDDKKAVEAEKKHLSLVTSLTGKNLPKDIADYLKDDIDIEKFSSVMENIINQSKIGNGYNPTGHSQNENMTKEQFKNLSYDDRIKLYNTNPTVYKALRN
jgi:hypothetical protein